MGTILFDELIEAAQKASLSAHCPYSQFPVGAAVQFSDGSIYVGANVENVSFGLTCCAERVAIFKGVTEGKKSLQAVVVFTPTKTPTPPCGACRQVIREFGSDVEILSACPQGKSERSSIAKLLPGAFDQASLKNG